ncbi:SWIB/MDM2 domain-containing protein [Amylostereum chailletii]|nr:SWIB/MDM2 domain-containing protein [Amylostereum chailletii]
MEISELEPLVYEILSAPDVDLASISAKRVRKQLSEDERVGADFVRINKKGVDELISEVFERVSAETGFQQSTEDDQAQEAEEDAASTKRSRDTTEDDAETRPPKKKRGKGGADAQAMSDAALARKLSEEINGRQRSSRSGTTSSSRGRGGKANGTKKRKTKSAETVDESGDEGADSEGAPKKKKRGGGGFKKPYQLSGALAEIVNEEQLPRPQVVKKLWEYIKANNLQNPANKREILCDGKMRAMFNMDKVNMFTMNKELNNHLFEPGTATA